MVQQQDEAKLAKPCETVLFFYSIIRVVWFGLKYVEKVENHLIS